MDGETSASVAGAAPGTLGAGEDPFCAAGAADCGLLENAVCRPSRTIAQTSNAGPNHRGRRSRKRRIVITKSPPESVIIIRWIKRAIGSNVPLAHKPHQRSASRAARAFVLKTSIGARRPYKPAPQRQLRQRI